MWNLLNSVSKTYPNAQGYSHLLKKLYDENFGIVSFNYDTLLDRSYTDVFGNTLSDKSKYFKANFVKLHGSVNWFLRKRPGYVDKNLGSDKHRHDYAYRSNVIAENIYNGPPMSLSQLEIIYPKLKVLDNIESLMNYFSKEGYFYPLLFMPLTGKDYSTVVDFKDQIIIKAIEMLKQATDVYLIGYRATDELIHDLLKNVRPGTKLHVVGRNMESVQDVLERTLKNTPFLVAGKLYYEGFEDFAIKYQFPH